MKKEEEERMTNNYFLQPFKDLSLFVFTIIQRRDYEF